MGHSISAHAKDIYLSTPEVLRRKLAAARWSTQELVHFLDGMPERLTRAQLIDLDKAFSFTGNGNAELAQRWYPLTIRSGYLESRPALTAFVEKIGRRKLIAPIYRALVATPDGLAYAEQIFRRVKPNYHPITAASIETILVDARKKLGARTP